MRDALAMILEHPVPCMLGVNYPKYVCTNVPVNIYVNLSLLNRKLCNSSTSLFLKQK